MALDVFRKAMYAKKVEVNERNGWLSFLCVEDVDEAEALLTDYPWLEEIYRDMTDCLHQPKEVLGMFSEALRILDRNTVQYMIDEQKREIEQLREELGQQRKENDHQKEAMEQQRIKEKQLEFENEQLKKRLAEYGK